MLVIRAEQMNVFKEVALRSFKNEMLNHLREFSPPWFKAVGEEQMREVIHFGIERAATHGFTFRGSVRLYLELMLVFGSYFDADPQYPWGAEILTHPASDSQMHRAELLFEKAMDYQQNVVGIDNIYHIDFLRNIVLLFQQPLTISTDNFLPNMLRVIDSLYSQKAAYVGREGLESLIRKAMGEAHRQRFSTVRGTVLVSVLMLAFSHGCVIDPLYPWIAQTLKDETLPDPDTKASQLEKNAMTWFEQVLANFNQGTSK